jgi:hypothetical protein
LKNDLPVLYDKTKTINEKFNKTYDNWKLFADDNLIKTMYSHKQNNMLNKSVVEQKSNNLFAKNTDAYSTINSKLDESVLSNRNKSENKFEKTISSKNNLVVSNDEYNKTYNEYFNSIFTRSNFNKKVNSILSNRTNMIDKKMSEINNEKILKDLLTYFDSYDLVKYLIPQYASIRSLGYNSINMNKLLLKISEKREKNILNEISSGKLKDKETIRKLIDEIQSNSWIFNEDTLNLLNEKVK